MEGSYLGRLSSSDPLFGYLSREIFPAVGGDAGEGIRVFSTNGSNAVYIYEDRVANTRVVGKFFFSPRMPDWDAALRRLEREYRNISEVRSYVGGRHYAARALGRNDQLNRLLVVEFCRGERLDAAITEAIERNNRGRLFERLSALADFLSELHNRSARPEKVDFNFPCRYLDAMLEGLGSIAGGEAGELRYWRDRWRNLREMWEDNEVLVHGDATPSNFLFGDGRRVVAFDMERARRTDRCFDAGRIAGELQHFFLRATGDKYAAEPFIGHFLWEYACRFPDRERAFRSITFKIPYYMGLTLLRIARNGYLESGYRRRLVREALECLKRRQR